MKYKSGYKDPELGRKHRENMGCFGIKDRVIHRIDKLMFKTCIGNFFSNSAIYLLEACDQMEHGILPYPGSYMDQPNKIIDAFRIINLHKREKAIADHNEQVRQSKTRGRS